MLQMYFLMIHDITVHDLNTWLLRQFHENSVHVTVFDVIEVKMNLAEEDKATYACGLLCPQPSLMLSISSSSYADCPEDVVLYQEHQCGKYVLHEYGFS